MDRRLIQDDKRGLEQPIKDNKRTMNEVRASEESLPLAGWHGWASDIFCAPAGYAAPKARRRLR